MASEPWGWWIPMPWMFSPPREQLSLVSLTGSPLAQRAEGRTVHEREYECVRECE